MSALTTKRIGRSFKFRLVELTLTGAKGYHNGRACFNGSGKVVPASSVTGLTSIGKFETNPHESVDATSADKTVTVDLEDERDGEWFANATNTDAVAATDIGKIAYWLDDQTVTITAAGRSPAGRIWGYDATKNLVLVEVGRPPGKSVLSTPAGAAALPAFAANDCVPTALEHDAVYAIPAYGANSTVTLPTTAPDGIRVHFVNDGTSAFTLTYRDGNGNVVLNTATTASKRHGATAIKAGGKWVLAGLTVAP
jgi:hypothetical protein